MKGYWSDVRPNGQPVEPGTFCWITDLEDGTHPIPTYGKTQDEVMGKLAAQNANAQIALAARRSAPAAAQLPEPRVISPDQVMRATQDLENPAKAGEAIATLVESHTGIDLNQLALQNFAQTASQWESAHPDFYPHPGNKRMLTSEAAALAGGNLGKVTHAHLNQAYAALKAQGYLLEVTVDLQGNNGAPSLPDESQVQRERQRTRFATGARSSSFQRQSNAHTRTLKYTEEQIRTMPMSQSRELIANGDRDYADACEAYYGSQQATA